MSPHGAGETGQDRAAVQRIVITQSDNRAVHWMDFNGTSVWIHDPYKGNSVTQPHLGLTAYLGTTVAGGRYFDFEVGDKFYVSRYFDSRRPFVGGKESNVRFTHCVGVSFQADPGVGYSQFTQTIGFDKGAY